MWVGGGQADDQPNWCDEGNVWAGTCQTQAQWECGYYNQLYERGLTNDVPDACYVGYIDTRNIDNWCIAPGPLSDGTCDEQPTPADNRNLWTCGYWGAQIDLGNVSAETALEVAPNCYDWWVSVRHPDWLAGGEPGSAEVAEVADGGDCTFLLFVGFYRPSEVVLYENLPIYGDNCEGSPTQGPEVVNDASECGVIAVSFGGDFYVEPFPGQDDFDFVPVGTEGYGICVPNMLLIPT